jgi:hypothetical protein
MSKIEKLIEKAYYSPQNVTFDELCTILEYYGFIKRKGDGSHMVYKRSMPPMASFSIQRGSCGKAKGYQIKQLINWVEDNLKGEN